MGIDFSQIGSMLGGLTGGAGGSPDLSALGNLDLSSLGSLFGGATKPSSMGEPSTPVARPEAPESPPGSPHEVAAAIYVVCSLSQRDRLIRSMGRSCEPGSLIDVAEITADQGPPRWAIIPQKTKPATAGWPESLQALGYSPPAGVVSGAEIARRLSEQCWGSAWADHRGEAPITLVFHDGILTRAAWGGDAPGVYPDEAAECTPAVLLAAFLEDPTDDTLSDLTASGELRQLDS